MDDGVTYFVDDDGNYYTLDDGAGVFEGDEEPAEQVTTKGE